VSQSTSSKATLNAQNAYDILTLAFSPDGGLIATAGTEKKITVWE
jgi:WD40 repeat protein